MKISLALIPALMSLLAPAGLFSADDLPKAETILEKYVAVTGGRTAYARMQNASLKGDVEIPEANIKGTISVVSSVPAESYAEVELAGVGKFIEGTHNGVAWSYSEMQGARIKQGEEAAIELRHAYFNSRVHWDKVYSSVETTGVENIDGKLCYKLKLIPASGAPETAWYDVEKGYLVRQMSVSKNAENETTSVEATFSDYRSAVGILTPHHIVQIAGPQTIVITFNEVVYNTDIPKQRFEPPAPVRALMSRSE